MEKAIIKLISYLFYEKGTQLGKRCSGYEVYLNGSVCYGCSDCNVEKDEIVKYLFGIIDDIDTASDIAKSNDGLYRILVHRYQLKRWNTGIKTDGHTLDLSNMKRPYMIEAAKENEVECAAESEKIWREFRRHNLSGESKPEE